MHLILQICGVAGFGLFFYLYPGFIKIRAGLGSATIEFAIASAASGVLISTYFIFG